MRRLRIGIDGYNLALPHGTGIATYGRVLAEVLAGGGHAVEGLFGIDAGGDPALREVNFFDRLGREPPPVTRRQFRAAQRRLGWDAVRPWQRVEAVEVPVTGRVETAQLADRLPAFDRLTTAARLFDIAHARFRRTGRFARVRMADPPPIMHWTYPVPVMLEGSRNLYTLHDLVPLRLPYTTLDRKPAYRRILEGCIAHAAHLCTVSEASRSDIRAEFGLPGEAVTNTYQASPAGTPPPEGDEGEIGRLFGLERDGYFLFFGAIEPKKNLGRLIEAFLSLPTDTPLVIVGGKGWQSEGELRLIPPPEDAETAHGRAIERRIRRLEHLPRRLLLKLIGSARAVLFPSLFEGFGLPVLEAMQMGTPVLCSDTSSLPEVAGDAAVLVDPYSVAAIAAGLRALDEDAGLRARLRAAGPEQARRFAPDRYLARLEAMYGAMLERPA